MDSHPDARQEAFRLTSYARCAGWAAKIPPKDLVEALANLPRSTHPDLIVGPDTLDDAGVYRISDDLALVQTVDFFPPIVDDPLWYGRIAAANSLSDVYAMGGRPITALNVVGFPKEVDLAILAEILRGGHETVTEAGAVMAGGHSLVDEEIKYGLSVTGVVDPRRLVGNAGAQAGDALVLTKPLGMGAMTTALRNGNLSAAQAEAIAVQMATLNRAASEAMVEVGVGACTDVTGFGLLGHASNLARASGVTLTFEAAAVPFFAGARGLARDGVLSGGAARCQAWLEGQAEVASAVAPEVAQLCFDAETSGGLLVAVAAERLERLVQAMRGRGVEPAVVGRVEEAAGLLVRLVP